jgi:hypothetical protein
MPGQHVEWDAIRGGGVLLERPSFPVEIDIFVMKSTRGGVQPVFGHGCRTGILA